MDEEGYIKSLREGKVLPCFAARKKKPDANQFECK